MFLIRKVMVAPFLVQTLKKNTNLTILNIVSPKINKDLPPQHKLHISQNKIHKNMLKYKKHISYKNSIVQSTAK